MAQYISIIHQDLTPTDRKQSLTTNPVEEEKVEEEKVQSSPVDEFIETVDYRRRFSSRFDSQDVIEFEEAQPSQETTQTIQPSKRNRKKGKKKEIDDKALEVKEKILEKKTLDSQGIKAQFDQYFL